MEDLFKIIGDVAAKPSFSGSEWILHPYIKNFLNEHVPEHEIVSHEFNHNLVVAIPGNRNAAPVAICAHLDKIDHWGVLVPEMIAINRPEDDGERIHGSLDDAVGVGICLWLARWLQTENTPPLYLLFSRMEENGMVGATEIALSFDQRNLTPPTLIVNVDICPFFGDDSGVAVYSHEAVPYQLVDELVTKFSPILLTEGLNDFVVYRAMFPGATTIAVEPAVANMHTVRESCYKRDIEKVVELLKFILTK
jgi:putative aminopeptidase FrvX